jgi:hypothetical protein
MAVMQGRSEDQRELLDAESVVGHLIKPGSVFAFLAEHRKTLFPDAMFADLFPSTRAAVGAGGCDGVGDRAADVARHVGLGDHRRDHLRSAVEGRGRLAADGQGVPRHDLDLLARRLAASQDPNRIFTAVQTVIAQTGALKGKTRRALDSTVLDDAVATQDTVTQLIAAIRRVRREVPAPRRSSRG